ncbi:hypothetical protein PUMCH_000141 [Australozyma saopauloensis]|uniref:B-related factor 1 n=1 Tax=Australozyma saopauloensis TaxID=291208 RepID=A0AAX4H355_9ASCO|nr:hypothetical protein PUMCH_000141 [[Candida] saopauloensis]
MSSKERKCICGCTHIARDPSSVTNEMVCQQCGLVQEENSIVSEVQFGESSSGAAVVQGSMVGPNQTRAFSHGSALESKEHTLMRAKQRMKLIAASMRIQESVLNTAFGCFQLALANNFVKGRRSQNVLAACLYVACRKEKTNHLLIDFSSRLQISVYSLGATFLKLIRVLNIENLEPIDISLFIEHYAEKLDFGTYTTKVVKDARNLAKRMSADWICSGRRPAGIAAACLLLAARMNNFQRSHAELVAVAHVAEETIQKRMNEFKKTASAKITVLGFREAVKESDYFTQSQDRPPAINRNKEIEKKFQKVLRQRERTLERHRELARKRKLLSSLDIVPELSIDSNPEAAEKMSETIENNDNDEELDEAEILKSVNNISPETLARSGISLSESNSTKDKVAQSTTEDQSPETDTKDDKNPTDVINQDNTEGEEKDQESNEASDDETNDLFVPNEDDDDFGYDDLPDAPSDNDELYEEDADDDDDDDYPEPKSRLSKLESEYETVRPARRSGRLEGLNAESSTSRMRFADTPTPRVPRPKKSTRIRIKKEKIEKDKEASEDGFLKAILDGGSLKEEDIEKALDAILQKNHSSKPTFDDSTHQSEEEIRKMIDSQRPRNLVKGGPSSSDILKKVRDDEELDDMDDDDEVNDVKLLEEEMREKERMWIAINHDFLIAQEKKRLKLVADELAGNSSGQVKRRRTVTVKQPPASDSVRQNSLSNRTITPAESTRQMLLKKTYSKKINYDMFPQLFAE